MLARIAQELFWLGRDLTRAEHTARMLDGVFHAELGAAGEEFALRLSWDALLAVIGARPPVPGSELTGETDPVPEQLSFENPSAVIHLLTVETSNPASVFACVRRGRQRALSLRDVISTEMWEAVNTFHMTLEQRSDEDALRAGPYSIYSYVKQRCALFWGLVERTMIRDEARAFLEAGARLEDADMVLRMLRVTLPQHSVDDEGVAGNGIPWAGELRAIALLHAIGGAQAYSRSVRQPANAGPVARFLLFDQGYPGSVACAIEALGDALAAADSQPRSSPPALRVARMLADLEFEARASSGGQTVGSTVGRVQEELAAVDSEIATRYFAGAVSPVPLAQ